MKTKLFFSLVLVFLLKTIKTTLPLAEFNYELNYKKSTKEQIIKPYQFSSDLAVRLQNVLN